jgi:hypothetical protein
MLRLLDSKTRIFCPSEAKNPRFQALLELMPVRLNSGLNLEIQIRPDSSSIFKRFFHSEPIAEDAFDIECRHSGVKHFGRY